MDRLSTKFWVVAIADFNVPVLSPCLHGDHFLGSLVKTAPSPKAVLLNGQTLAEAEPGLIWTDQSWRKITLL